MKKSKKALLVVNLGTPNSPETGDVRRYLSEFLNDRRVIDLPWVIQKMLVNLIIVPFRSPKSSRLYKKLWSSSGSPILHYLNRMVEKIQSRLPVDYDVIGAMRYGFPSLKDAMKKLENGNYDEIIVFPLFPQYASSTTGSVNEFIMKKAVQWQVIPAFRFIDQYYDHPAFIRVFSDRIRCSHPELFSHIIFSYHGLPERHINKTHPGIDCRDCSCSKGMTEFGRHCYKAACYETTRLLAEKLDLKTAMFTTTFQSRLSKKWLNPFTDESIINLASDGHRKILVVAPSFVADCLETTIEIGEQYRELFRKLGGEDLTCVESLNDNDAWADAITEITGLQV
jgi:ferrochelatase